MAVGFLILLFIFFPAPLHAQTGSVVEVLLYPPPSESASCSLLPTDRTEITDHRGSCRFEDLPSGSYRLHVAAEGWVPVDTLISVADADFVQLVVYMKEISTVLPDVTVEATGFNGTFKTFQRSDIHASGAATLPDFLAAEAGLDLQTDGTVGAVSSVRIGGSNTNQVLVLVDGRRLQNVGSGVADLSEIPLESVENVSVHRGSHANIGAEAIGGILEITTREPSSLRETSISATLYPTYYRTTLQQSASESGIPVLASYTRTEGPGDFRYRIIEDDGVGEFTENLGQEQHRRNADVVRDQLFVKIQNRADANAEVTGTLFLNRTEQGMPGYLAPQLTLHARQQSGQNAANLIVKKRFGKTALSARSSYEYNHRDYRNPDPYTLTVSSTETTRRWTAELKMIKTIGNTRISSGGEVAREEAESRQLTSGSALRDRWEAWSQFQRVLYKNMAESFHTGFDAGARISKSDFSSAQFLPRIELNIETSPSYLLEVWASWGRSYRIPTFYSLFWLDDQVAMGNPDLKPELSEEWVGGVLFDTQDITHTRINVDVSDQWIDQLIYWHQSFDNKWKPRNLKEAHVQTLDLGVEQSLLSNRIRLTVNTMWTEARDATKNRNTGGKYLVYRPPRTHRVSASYRNAGWLLNTGCRWISARPVLASNSKWLSEYEVFDAEISRQFTLGGVSICAAVGAKDLFDEQYRIIRFAPMPGREVYLSTALNWQAHRR